jgi:4-amino-4-deoxy-L-arabinose transferase-like glycosyltransferase
MLVASALVPLVLFTLARGLLPTYPLPALGAIALLLGRDLSTARGGGADVGGRSLAWIPRGVTLSLAFVVGVLLALPARSWTPVCHEAMVRAAAGRVPVYARPLTFLYSARFYSDGRAREAPDVDAPVWDDVRAQPSAFAVLVKEGRDAAVPHDLRPRLRREGVVGGTYVVHAVAPWDGAP